MTGLVGLLVGCGSDDCMIGWLQTVGWLQVGWLAGWPGSTGWFVGGLVGWLAGWLVV